MTQEVIRQLRNITTTSIDPEQLVNKLLKQMPCRYALEAVLSLVHEQLAAFEQRNPHISWVRQWVEAALELRQIDYSKYSFGFYHEDDLDESSAAYVSAIALLDEALQSYHQGPSSKCVDFSASALAHVIFAKLIQFRMDYYPASWPLALKYQNDESVDKQTYDKIRAFKLDQTYIDFESQLWSHVADEIESRL